MGTDRKFRKKPMTRPVKRAGAARQRSKVQKARLVALGMDAEVVAKMDSLDVRTLLKRPLETAKKIAKAKAKKA